MTLKGKIALITGGSRGIGAAIVRAFVSEGATVYFTYHTNKDKAEAITNALGKTRAIAVEANVTKRNQFKELFTDIAATNGRLDILVNNAGINKPTDFHTISDDDWDQIMAVNLKGPFMVTQEALSLLKKSKGASVIHIGSVSGQYGGPRTAHYAASKAGLISLSQVIARFGAEHGIRSNTLAAGLVASDMADAALDNPAVRAAAKQVLLGRFATMDEIADAAVFLASDASSYITAQTINVNGGLYF